MQLAADDFSYSIDFPEPEYPTIDTGIVYTEAYTFNFQTSELKAPQINACNGVMPLPQNSLVEKLLNDPKTIHFRLSRKVEEFIPLTGSGPYRTYQFMSIVE